MRLSYVYLTLIFTFLIGIHEGYVALWREPGGKPDLIFPYSAASLPEEDQKRLEAGISIGSEEELIHLLEDYLS